MYENGLSMQDMWETFKYTLIKDIESTIPSKSLKKRRKNVTTNVHMAQQQAKENATTKTIKLSVHQTGQFTDTIKLID